MVSEGVVQVIPKRSKCNEAAEIDSQSLAVPAETERFCSEQIPPRAEEPSGGLSVGHPTRTVGCVAEGNDGESS
jgi:hypothetical protein